MNSRGFCIEKSDFLNENHNHTKITRKEFDVKETTNVQNTSQEKCMIF